MYIHISIYTAITWTKLSLLFTDSNSQLASWPRGHKTVAIYDYIYIYEIFRRAREDLKPIHIHNYSYDCMRVSFVFFHLCTYSSSIHLFKIYMHMYTHMYIYIYTCIHMGKFMYICVCVHCQYCMDMSYQPVSDHGGHLFPVRSDVSISRRSG